MPFTILVSCDSKRTAFRECIKQICAESHGEYQYRYIPDEVAPANERDRLQRMLDLVRDSDMVFMDATPAKGLLNRADHHATNSGVLIEYGVLVSKDPYMERLRVFCDKSVSRSFLHPYILKTVHDFDGNDSESLKVKVIKMIEDYKARLPEMIRKQREELEAYKQISRINKA